MKTPARCPGLLIRTVAKLVPPLGQYHRVSVGFPGVVRERTVVEEEPPEEPDEVTDPEGSKNLVARAGTKDKVLKLYPGLVHDLIHEPEKETVMTDIEKWLEAHSGK